MRTLLTTVEHADVTAAISCLEKDKWLLQKTFNTVSTLQLPHEMSHAREAIKHIDGTIDSLKELLRVQNLRTQDLQKKYA